MSFLIRRFGADIVKPDYLQALRGIVLIEDLGKPHFPVSQHKALPVMEHVLAGFLTDRRMQAEPPGSQRFPRQY